MEVLAVPTPTYSGNCKPNLESFLVESVATRPNDFDRLAERDTELLTSLNID
jgi:hypothetical protein